MGKVWEAETRWQEPERVRARGGFLVYVEKVSRPMWLASGLASFGCKSQRDSEAHFGKQRYFKGEKQENPGKRRHGLKVLGFVEAGWLAPYFN